MCDEMIRHYVVGEKRLIEWELKPNTPLDTVVVTEARYEIINTKGKAICESGSLTVEGTRVSYIFEAKEAGSFVLRIFVTVPPEIVEGELRIDVVG